MASALTVYDYTDRELLHILADAGDSDGYAGTAYLASVIGVVNPADDPHHANRCVGMRYAYMARQGWVEKDPESAKKGTRWRVTRLGQALMSGKLNKTMENGLTRLQAGDRVLLMRSLTRSYQGDALPARVMIRREWQNGTKLRG